MRTKRITPGQILSHSEMCMREKKMLQNGMHFRPNGATSVLLMSRRKNAPYDDRIEREGQILTYEGHDENRSALILDPKKLDQPMRTKSGSLTQNGLFYEAAKRTELGAAPERVRVYEKIRPNIWTYNGTFNLLSAEIVEANGRKVFKFKLELIDEPKEGPSTEQSLPHTRIIPSHIKQEVYKRDGGKCVKCGSTENLHFDHDFPYAKGGTSLLASNIRLLCAKHNLSKSDKIE